MDYVVIVFLIKMVQKLGELKEEIQFMKFNEKH